MSSWSMASLSDLGKISRGKSKHRPRNDAALYGGNYPFIQTGDVKEANFYINEHSQTYNESGLKQSKLWEKDTLCITIAANIAESALLKFPACFPDSIVGFIPYEGVSDVRYVKYLLDNYKTEFQKRSKGATQDNLSVDKINSLKVKVPDYPYQVKVAEIISAYDYLIENNQNRIHILEEMALRLYKEWFVQFKFPGYENAKMIDSQTEFGLIPEDWIVKPLAKEINIIRGKSYSSNEIDQYTGKYYLVNLKSFNRGGGFRFDGKKFFNGEINEEQRLNTGDIVMAVTDMTRERAVIARPARIPKINHSLVTLSADVVKIESESLPNVFLFFLLFDDRFTELTKAKANGANVLHLKPHLIGQYYFVLPPAKLMEKFNNVVMRNVDLIDDLNIKNENLLQMRNLLIEKLVTGKQLLKS